MPEEKGCKPSVVGGFDGGQWFSAGRMEGICLASMSVGVELRSNRPDERRREWADNLKHYRGMGGDGPRYA